MINLQSIGDKVAIGLSLLCTLHCLAMPALLVLLPSLALINFINDEAFHMWMLAAVIPISIYALVMGYKKHQNYGLLITGMLGIALLIGAIVLGEAFESELLEKSLTVAGAFIVAFSHFKNYKLCSSNKLANNQSKPVGANQ